MSDKELIEKIEDAYRRVRKIGPDAIYETELREVLRAAADALEARQPREAVSEDDREELKKALKEALYIGIGGMVGSYVPAYKAEQAVEEMLSVFSRAAVPDAATEELERIKPLFENLSREYPNECNKRVKAEAERDAALAALERVRAEADAYAEQPDVMEPCGAVAQALRTALDGGGSDE